MELIFKIDRDYDEKMIFEFMPKKNKKKELANLLRIDIEDMEKLLEKKPFNIKRAVHSAIEEKYKTILPFIKNSVKSYQTSWNKINDEFSKLVENKTKNKWKYKKYYCVVSAFHEGISNWGGNTIVRIWSINADTQRPVTAHEVVLSHCWTILEKNNIAKKWSNNDKWKYSEIYAWCLLGLEKEFHKLWPWLLEKHRFPLDHNYPEIVPLQKKLRKLYLQSQNFQDFIDKSIKYNKGT